MGFNDRERPAIARRLSHGVFQSSMTWPRPARSLDERTLGVQDKWTPGIPGHSCGANWLAGGLTSYGLALTGL